MSKKKIAPVQKKPAASPAAKGRHGLGRGLGALISAVPASVDAAHAPNASAVLPPSTTPLLQPGQQSVLSLPVGEIARCPWQPRSVFDQEALRELADSIKAHGVIQPLICRTSAGGGFELIAGERRLRAAIEAGLGRVPVIVLDAADRDAAEMAVIENIQREDLNVIEEAEGYRTLAETFNLTQQEVA
ncbi:MAG: ParB/RepB/Spo0J family partition protein, partial [Lentisphaerota bacterium]